MFTSSKSFIAFNEVELFTVTEHAFIRIALKVMSIGDKKLSYTVSVR
jgi:hypothetical protein